MLNIRLTAFLFFIFSATASLAQSNIDSIIESGNFLEAQEKINTSRGQKKVQAQIKLLTELKQYSKARKLLIENNKVVNKNVFLGFLSDIDIQTNNQKNSISYLSEELNDSTTSYEGTILFELSKQYNSIDSLPEAQASIIKSIQLLSESSNDTIKLDQLMLFTDILSSSGKKKEALQVLHSVQVLSQSAETKLTLLKRKQYDTYSDLKKGIILRELGQIEEALASLQTCEFKIHSIDKLWALKIKKSLYQAFQITLFIQGNKDKMFAYNIKSSINKEIIDDLIFNFFDSNVPYHSSNLNESEKEEGRKVAANTSNNYINTHSKRDELINWIAIGLLILTIGILSILLSKRKKENLNQLEQINERDKAFKLYQNQVLSQSTSESKKIIQEIGMLSKRQSKWSKKLEEIVEESSKTKKQDIIDAVSSITQEMQSDVKIDQKKSQLNDNVRKVSNDFKKRLKTRYPQLIRSEIELCALIRLRMSNKEIAEVRDISLSSARTARYRLKKKLNIPENLEIEQVLLAI
jgi:DNA-binding CsgD family transcriptional regulator